MMRTQATPERRATDLRIPSRRALSLFSFYVRSYVGRHFHAVRVANPSRIPLDAEPLILFANHSSWWDPLAGMLLGQALLPHREHYAPMDSTSLQHYAIFRSMGFFPVENGSPRGAAQLLRAGSQILSRPGAVLWITPESQFQDVRKRPIEFRPGIGALISRSGRLTCLPIAVEYTFWNERLPEILINIGEPLEIADGAMELASTWTNLCSFAMAATLDELTMLATDRDPETFVTIVSGTSGIGGIYEIWKRFASLFTRRRYIHDHGTLHHK